MSFALSVILKTTIILASASLIALGLRRASASVRHAVWAAALLAVLLLPFGTLFLPPVTLPVLPEGTVTGEPSTLELADISQFLGFQKPESPKSEIRNSLVRPPQPRRPWQWQLWIVLAWMAGAAVVLFRLLVGSLRVRRLGQTAAALYRSDWLEVLERVKADFSIKRPVRLMIGDPLIPPMTWGIFRHVILLPGSAKEWTAERRRLVLAHELAHVKRNDGITQILVQAICSLHWFNPLAWYASKQLRIERECACDDQVLKIGADADDYADHLLQVARDVNPGGSLSVATVAMAHRSQLETRLLSILDTRTKRHNVPRSVTAALLGGMTALTLSFATIHLTAKPGAPPLPPMLPPIALFSQVLSMAPGVVQGVVMQLGTDVPLRDVLVSLTPVEVAPGTDPVRRYDVATRPDGTFAVTDLPPGQYKMSLVHDDFVRLHSTAEPVHVTVGDGRPAGDIRLHMMPGPAISGRVFDENGNTKSSTPVELMRLEYRDGQRGLFPTDISMITDEHGEYRFFGLDAGEYYLRTRPKPGTADFLPLYYPGVTDSQHAMPISVRAGADITGIDLSLTKGNQHSVKLKVAIASPVPAQPDLSFYVNPRSRGGGAASGPGMHFNLVGDTYVSPLLTRGTYEIEVYLRDPDPVRWGRVTVSIDDADVDAGTLTIGTGTSISGRVTAIENLPVAVHKGQLSVVLRPLDGSMLLLPSTKVAEDGTFVVSRVPDRRFRIDLAGLPPEVYMASARFGGKEVRDTGITVSGDFTGQLELSLAAQGGAVVGVVRNAKDQPMAGSQVVLIPSNRDVSSLFKTATTDQSGVFSIAGVAPGEYSVLAWQEPHPHSSLDPAFLKTVENQITKIVVQRSFTNNINVRALPPPN